MDLALQRAINGFGVRHRRAGVITRLRKQFTGASEADNAKLFEHFATYHVMSGRKSFVYDDDLSDFIVTGAKHDLGLDAIAIAIGGELVLATDDLKQRLQSAQARTADVELIFIQVTLAESPGENKINSFLAGVSRFMSPPLSGRQSATLRERHAAISHLMDWLRKNRPGYKPKCSLFVAWTGSNETIKRHLAHLMDAGRDNSLQLNRDFSACHCEMLYGPDLLELVKQDELRSEIKLVCRGLVRGCNSGQAPKSLIAIVSAKAFINAVTDGNGKLVERLFYENVRSVQDLAGGSPGESMDLTLRSNEQSQFFARNNGIVLIVRGFTVEANGTVLVLSNAQIVNGCQTGHALYRNRGHLTDDVELTVKIVCAHDEALISAIIRSSNFQTPITEIQFLSRSSYARRLEMHFQARDADDGKAALWFERLSGSRAAERERASDRVMSIEDMMKMFVSIYHELPEHAQSLSWADLREMVPVDIFNHDHDPALYYSGALVLLRCREFMRTQAGGIHRYPAKNHLALVTRILAAGAKDWPGMEDCYDHDAEYNRIVSQAKYAVSLEKALQNSGMAAKIVARAHDLIVAAVKELGGTFEADTMRRDEVTAKVIEKAALASGR